MRLSENRTVAWIVLALVIAFALGLSGNALEKKRAGDARGRAEGVLYRRERRRTVY